MLYGGPLPCSAACQMPIHGVRKLDQPRTVWVMLPAGEITEGAIRELGELLEPGDIVIDGGNTFWKDDIRRAAALRQRNLHYVDVGTSGGVWGLERGYCMMIGGERDVVDRLDPIFAALAPGLGDVPRTPGRDGRDPRPERGYLYAGPNGAGHFVKMVHNGIEYGLMQAYAEGFELMHESEYDLELAAIAHLWNQGSVVRSWLCELAERAFETEGNDLSRLEGYVQDSGEGRWTVIESIDRDVPAPVITLSLLARFASRQDDSYSAKMLAALRNQFGGHAVKASD
jgi:6-phosphogluconate dehydrogenase